jgi:hypothetical protein
VYWSIDVIVGCTLREKRMAHDLVEWLKAIGILIAAVSLYLAYRQFRATLRWNRINATFTYLPEAVYLEREGAAANALQAIGVDLYKQEKPLSAEAVMRILDDSQIFKNAKDFLNQFEDYAAAYRAHAIDRDHSYLLSASRFIRHYEIFRPLIDELRHQRKNPMYLREFEKLVTEDWLPRRTTEIKAADRKRDEERKGGEYS